MSSRAASSRTISSHGTFVIAGFLAGFLATFAAHQVVLACLHEVSLTARGAFVLEPTNPFGVPAVLSTAFWGGLWGVVLAFAQRRFPPRLRYLLSALMFGVVAPTLVGWFVVPLLKDRPFAAGWRLSEMASSILINAAWGLGAALLLRCWFRWKRIT